MIFENADGNGSCYENPQLGSVAKALNFFLKLEHMLQEGMIVTYVSISVTWVIVAWIFFQIDWSLKNFRFWIANQRGHPVWMEAIPARKSFGWRRTPILNSQ